MLGFHEQIISDLLQEENGGLVVLGAGLGLRKLVASLICLHDPSQGALFVLSASDTQRHAIREELGALDSASNVTEINADNVSLQDRVEMYKQGGAFFITTRILVVDLLNDKVPLSRVQGIIILNAHKLTETCAEAFIVRLYRFGNKKGYVRAFSDRPHAMVSGFSKPERIMKSLFIKKLHIWPRFQVLVSDVLEKDPPEVVDIRVPLTSYMSAIQSAILEVMDACLKELRKTNKLDMEDLTVANGLFKSFHEIVRQQLNPIWHIIGKKTKQLVEDLRTLRKLAEYLIRYDSVTYLKYLDALRVSEGIHTVWIFANPSHKIFDFSKKRVYKVIKSDGGNVVSGNMSNIRKDTSKKSKIAMSGSSSSEASMLIGSRDSENSTSKIELEVVGEEMPKWTILREVLEEIEEERQKAKLSNENQSIPQDAWDDGGGSVLVACKDERACVQLQDCIYKGAQKLMLEEWERYLLGKTELHGIQTTRKKKTSKGYGILDGRVPGRSKAHSNVICSLERDALLAAAADLACNKEAISAGAGIEEIKGAAGRGRGRGGRRGRGSRRKGTTQQKQIADFVKPSEVTETVSISDSENSTSAHTKDSERKGLVMTDMHRLKLGSSNNVFESERAERNMDTNGLNEENNGKIVPPAYFYALENENRILEVMKPVFIVVYDPDMAFVREIEIYKAENPGKPLKVYFLFYDKSIEVQKFEASIQRENSAFESLIRQKSMLMIPTDQDGYCTGLNLPPQPDTGISPNRLTRKAGGRKEPEKQKQVIVDVREFMSSLPSVLHQQGMKIIPVTLEVGDYILSPEICVERKSLSDLYGSFSSGRLYHQADVMTRYYRLPVLLIEFSQDRSFSFQAADDIGDDISSTSIFSKLSLLVLHFPRLRLVWSRSLHATAEIFASLKANQDEPDVSKAMRVGVPSEDGLIEGDIRAETYNTSAVELLRRLPGVSDANYRSLIDGCNNLAELALLPLEKLAELMGGVRSARMLREFLDAKCPTLL